MYFRSPAVCEMLWFGLRRRLHCETDHGLRVRILRAMLLTTSDKDQPLYALLRGQDRSGLAYPRPEFLALLNGIVTFFEKIAKDLPRTHVLELLVEPHLEDVPLLNCPESVANSHGRWSASLIANKFFRILLVNHSTRVTDDNEKHMNYTHKPSRKHFRL
ncbi:unnamed protein product [Ixodes persulcatus]